MLENVRRAFDEILITFLAYHLLHLWRCRSVWKVSMSIEYERQILVLKNILQLSIFFRLLFVLWACFTCLHAQHPTTHETHWIDHTVTPLAIRRHHHGISGDEKRKLYACPCHTSSIWKSSACCLRLFAVLCYIRCEALSAALVRVRMLVGPRFSQMNSNVFFFRLRSRRPKKFRIWPSIDRKWFIRYDKDATILRIFILSPFVTSVIRFCFLFCFCKYCSTRLCHLAHI